MAKAQAFGGTPVPPLSPTVRCRPAYTLDSSFSRPENEKEGEMARKRLAVTLTGWILSSC